MNNLDLIQEKLIKVIPRIELPFFMDDIAIINRLKKERKAIILAHNYQSPEIYHGVADIVGDSLALAREAQKTNAEIIVLAGVHFMAETAKLLNPDKIVLIPDLEAGCSLAASITGADVRLLKEKYPGVPVVTYVNTSAAVKAEADVCCTSGNAVEVVESLGSDTVIFLPDEYLADFVAKQTKVKVIAWKGHCMVHEQFTAGDIRKYKENNPGIIVLAHPECPPDILAEADFAGSTASMQKYVEIKKPSKVILLTECSMASNLVVDNPHTSFTQPCNICPHMKRITLSKIRKSLETLTYKIEIDPEIAEKARRSVERMLEIKSR